MKELTKEECIKALDEIWFEANNGAIMCGDELSEEYNEILTQLIEEHFDNQFLDDGNIIGLLDAYVPVQRVNELEDEIRKLEKQVDRLNDVNIQILEDYHILVKALMKACKLLHKAGVVAGKKDGKPIRLGTNAWYDKLLEDAKNDSVS